MAHGVSARATTTNAAFDVREVAEFQGTNFDDVFLVRDIHGGLGVASGIEHPRTPASLRFL